MQNSQKAFYLNSRIGSKHRADLSSDPYNHSVHVEIFDSFGLPGGFLPYYITT